MQVIEVLHQPRKGKGIHVKSQSFVVVVVVVVVLKGLTGRLNRCNRRFNRGSFGNLTIFFAKAGYSKDSPGSAGQPDVDMV